MLEIEIKNLTEAVKLLTDAILDKTGTQDVPAGIDMKAIKSVEAELKTAETGLKAAKTNLRSKFPTGVELKKAILKYAEKHDHDEAKKLLASFGGFKLSDISEDKRQEVIDATL